MPAMIPPYDFPSRPMTDGEKIEVIVEMARYWLRRHPAWVPFIYRFALKFR